MNLRDLLSDAARPELLVGLPVRVTVAGGQLVAAEVSAPDDLEGL